MLPNMYFQNEGLLAMTSEGSLDFTPQDFNSPLMQGQRDYLKKHTGLDIPQVFWRKQIHGDDVLRVKGTPAGLCGAPDADAFITDEINLPIAIRTADCVPVFIFEAQKRIIGLVHAGWKGTYKTIAVKTVDKMKAKYACNPADLKVVLGPSIRDCCYQVGEDFIALFPGFIRARGNRLYLDMIGANREQLFRAGVRPENIVDTGICTCCDKNYFSFRRDGDKAGRMISLMMLI